MKSSPEQAALAPAKPHRYVNPFAVFAVLALSTIIEVGLTLMPGIPHQDIVPALLGLSFVKAALVALYYMHLRYEKWIYGLIFVTPAAFAVFLIIVLLA